MPGWKKALAIVDKLEEFFCSVLLLFLVALLFWQVLARFVFDTGMSASEELSRFTFAFFVLLAMSYGARERVHIRVSVFLMLLPEKARKIILIFADLIWIVFNSYVVYYGIVFVRRMIDAPRVTPIMGVNMAWIYLALPIAFALTNIRIIIHLVSGHVEVLTSEQEAEAALEEAATAETEQAQDMDQVNTK
jgi:TRAP-type C4-dicarboxylate transport system permease small subunit